MKLAVLSLLATALLAPASLTPEVAEPERVDFAELSGFEYREGMQLPPEVTRHHEREIQVSGFMQREDDGEGPVEFFMLVNDACGCEGMPLLNEIIFCAMPEGETVEIESGTVILTGKMFVGEEKEDDVVLALYCMDVSNVRRAP